MGESAFCVLGPVEAWSDKTRLVLGGPQQVKLLAFLLLNANRAVSADTLIDAVWGPERDRASKRLQMGVLRLRRALEPLDGPDGPRLRTVSGGYLLSIAPSELDADVFANRVREGRAALEAGYAARARELLNEGLDLWRGPPLADVAFEDFAQAEIRRLDELRLEARESGFDADLQRGRHGELIVELDGLLAEQPTRERLAGQLMTALYRSGRQADALEVYQRTRTHLAEELGLEPGPALKTLQGEILDQDASLAAGVPSAPTPARPVESDVLPESAALGLSPLAARLPVPPTPTIGRRQDVETVSGLLLNPAVRLVTLVGPGGVGKTRLALTVARMLDAPDGVYWVELAGVVRPDDVVFALARALGVPAGDAQRTRDALCLFLGRSDSLLVIDNFEHVLEAADLISELLAACPELTVLATSREALSLSGEHRVLVEPLPVPPHPDAATVSEVEAADATALFLAAARRRNARLVVTSADAPLIAQVCARLEGLPLALELAAARTTLLGMKELAARLEATLTDLGVGPRDEPDRHRTLQAAIEWSYHLLNPVQRTAFVRLAVFSGGATLHAASTVTDAEVESLEALVGKSLVDRRQQADGSTRLVMLETVRRYGLQRLAEDPEERAVIRRRHGEYYLHSVEQVVRQLSLQPANQPTGLLESDIENIQVAVRWALDEEPAWAPRLVDTVKGRWWLVGDRVHAVDLLERALAEVDERNEPRRYADLLFWLSQTQWSLGRALESLETAQHAVSIVPSQEQTRERAQLEAWLARVQLLRGRFNAGAIAAKRAIAAAVQAGDRRSQSSALNTLGAIQIVRGHVKDGSARLREAIALSREPGELDVLATAYANLANALNLAGCTLEALAVAKEAVATIPEYVTAVDGWLLLVVSEMAFEAGDWDTARSHLRPPRDRSAGQPLIFRRLCEAQLALGVGDLDTAGDCLTEIHPVVESCLQPQWIGLHGALLGELRLRQGKPMLARAAVVRTLDLLEDRTEDVMRVARVTAVGGRIEADIAQSARDRRDTAGERDAVSRGRLHLQKLRAAAQAGGPVELAWRTVGTAELTRACGRSDPTVWLDAAQRWDAIARPYLGAVARWRAAEAFVERNQPISATGVARDGLRTADALGSVWIVSEIYALADRAGLELGLDGISAKVLG